MNHLCVIVFVRDFFAIPVQNILIGENGYELDVTAVRRVSVNLMLKGCCQLRIEFDNNFEPVETEQPKTQPKTLLAA